MFNTNKIKDYLKNNIWFILFVLVIIYAFFIRFYDLAFSAFSINEAISTYIPKYISLGFWAGELDYYLFTWSQVFSFNLGVINQFWARFPSVIFGGLSLILIYVLSNKLFEDKRIAFFSAVFSSFFYWQIAWARQAEIFALLQFVFVAGITLITYRIQTKKIRFFNRSLLLVYIGIIFHPIFYTLAVLLLLAVIYQYGKAWDISHFKLREYKCTGTVLIALVVHYLLIKFSGGFPAYGGEIILEWGRIFEYIKNYNRHMITQLGIIYVLGILSMFRFIYKRRCKQILLLIVPFLIFCLFWLLKGYVNSLGYLLLIYPILTIGAFSFLIEFWDKIVSRYNKIAYVLIFLILGFFSVNIQFLPKSDYISDFSGTKYDFESVYSMIPEGQNIVSSIPVLCDWYYINKGKCYGALGNIAQEKNFGFRKTEKYTGLPYINNIKQLSSDIGYYFVIDDITISNIGSSEIYEYILENGRLVYEYVDLDKSILVYYLDNLFIENI